ncbi:hypothetical protein ACFCVO_08860 [Agromyces sp. NPDC056379]|uniref:hypothetical protein n=1 Tax=unclassified Agromyces TaxID=2639701 RepID=UPI0035E22787
MLQTVLTAAIAALVAFLFSALNDVMTERRSFKHRWDRDVFDLSVSFLGATRRLWHLAGEHAASDPEALNSAHQELRIECGKLLVLANPMLGEAALRVQREAYAVVKVATGEADPRPAEGDPTQRLVTAIDRFSRAARSQLSLPDLAMTRLD